MIKFILISICLISVKGDFEVTNLCTDHNTTSRSVIDYCKSQNGLLKFRCCFMSNTNNILAIDLTEMNLAKVPNVIEFPNLTNITMIDLRLNSQLELSPNDDFLNMLSLNFLYLPKQYPCPGEKRVWQVINQTTNPEGFLCMDQKDFCVNSTNTCIEPNSYCALNGPNHFLCLCRNGYYGYKCLRYGQFPAEIFFIVSIAITIILSGFFYWTQRRHVKND